MTQKLLYLCIPFFLTGCVGAIITGQTEYMGEGYPDIRTVPERCEALEPRGLHQGDENCSRAVDLEKLEQDWAKIKARDAALREQAFPVQTEPQADSSTPDDKDGL